MDKKTVQKNHKDQSEQIEDRAKVLTEDLREIVPGINKKTAEFTGRAMAHAEIVKGNQVNGPWFVHRRPGQDKVVKTPVLDEVPEDQNAWQLEYGGTYAECIAFTGGELLDPDFEPKAEA